MRTQLLTLFVFVVLSTIISGQRPVYPLIPLEGPSWFKPSGRNVESYGPNEAPRPKYNQPSQYIPVQNDAVPAPPGPPGQVPPADGKGRFIESDGVKTSCSNNADCYAFREPQKWCYLVLGSFWIEKGCYCDRSEGACIIQRKNPQELQWTWCASKDQWVCSNP